jgi:hypothetical protein
MAEKTFEDFLKHHGYEDGVTKTTEELIYWHSIWTYVRKGNPRRGVLRVRKVLEAYKELGKKEIMLKSKFYKALSEILIKDNELCYNFNTREVFGWPNVPNVEDGDANPAGPLDMENCSYISLTDTEFTMVCGGDWQNPHKVVIVMGVEGLEVSNCLESEFDDTSDDFEEELSDKLFLYKILG